MIRIGEKLNSSVPKTLEALNARDEGAIAEMIRAQSACGADFLDINTALTGDRETENMRWVISLALRHSDCGIMIDSPNPDVITACLPAVAGRALMINSVSLDDRYDALIGAAKACAAGFVCLPISGKKIPQTAGERLENAGLLIEKMRSCGVDERRLYVDVLIEAVATNDQAGLAALETIRLIKGSFPRVNTLCGLSNVSFGLPGRPKLNAAFLLMAMQCGLDSAILDVTSERIQEALFTGGALLGSDEYCLDYIGYYRKNRQ